MEDQKKGIANSLKILTDIFRLCKAEYRIIGSVLLVAYKNQVFRRIGDVDIILDAENKERVYKHLEAEGFRFTQKQWGGFHWVEGEKANHLELTFFLVGKFTKEYFTWRFFKIGELRINANYLKPTGYKFGGVTFIGIPITSVVAGIKQAFLNPKRSLDKKILREEIKSLKTSTYNSIHVYLGGIKIPYLYDVFSFLYNIYGGSRVLFGQRWEAWK
ncbi:hypothetical protein HYT32_00780 [Candidatus Roizmanbacteria bacterium]|nr:hypothetical protein [Candidatus Roizmanbacteria bacterium]